MRPSQHRYRAGKGFGGTGRVFERMPFKTALE